MENKKIYSDDIERVVNDGHENRKAKTMARYEKRRKNILYKSIASATIGLIFALFGICKWMTAWLAFPLFFGFVMISAFLFGRFFENGKCWGWK